MAIVTVATAKGGAAKTTTTLNLMHHFGLDEVVHLDVYGGILKLDLLRAAPFKKIHTPQTEAELLALLATDTKDKVMLVDCGGFDSTMVRLAVANSDFVLMPSNDDPTEQFAAQTFSEIVSNIGQEVGKEFKVYTLLNRVHPARRNFSDFDALIEALGNIERIPFVIPTATDVVNAQRQGKAVENGNIAYRYAKIAEFIRFKLIEGGSLNE
jgi:chromosome partitioning protein